MAARGPKSHSILSVFPSKKDRTGIGWHGRGGWRGDNPATRLSVFSNKKEGDGIESERVVGADLATSLSVCSNKKEELGEWWRGGAEVAFYFFSPFSDKKEGAGLAVA